MGGHRLTVLTIWKIKPLQTKYRLLKCPTTIAWWPPWWVIPAPLQLRLEVASSLPGNGLPRKGAAAPKTPPLPQRQPTFHRQPHFRTAQMGFLAPQLPCKINFGLACSSLITVQFLCLTLLSACLYRQPCWQSFQLTTCRQISASKTFPHQTQSKPHGKIIWFDER